MNARLAAIVRAARRPVMLITIGSLFAVQQAGGVSFGKTWPLLLVVFGCMLLLERMLMPRYARPYQAPGYVPPNVPPWDGLDSHWTPPYGQPQTPPPPPPPPFGGGPEGGATR